MKCGLCIAEMDLAEIAEKSERGSLAFNREYGDFNNDVCSGTFGCTVPARQWVQPITSFPLRP
jgi:hypothetical protein